MEQPDQLVLFGSNFVGADVYSSDKYIVSSANSEIITFLANMQPQKKNQFLLIIGGQFSGKSHILNFFANKNNGVCVNCFTCDDFLNDTRRFNKTTCIALDDIENFNELGLFHTLNYLKIKKKNVVMTTSQNVNDFVMRDLRSRLLNVVSIIIKEPDPFLFTGVLTKVLSEYDIKLNAKMIDYILKNSDHTFSNIFNIVESMREVVFIKKQKINLQIIKNILDSLKRKL